MQREADDVREKEKITTSSYDRENWKPVLKCSICNGEQVAGFQNLHTGEFKEERFILNKEELEMFCRKYEITGEIEKIY